MMQYFKRPWMIQPFINQMVKCNVRQQSVGALPLPAGHPVHDVNQA